MIFDLKVGETAVNTEHYDLTHAISRDRFIADCYCSGTGTSRYPQIHITAKSVGTTYIDYYYESYLAGTHTVNVTQHNGTVAYGTGSTYKNCEVYYATGDSYVKSSVYYGNGGQFKETNND